MNTRPQKHSGNKRINVHLNVFINSKFIYNIIFIHSYPIHITRAPVENVQIQTRIQYHCFFGFPSRFQLPILFEINYGFPGLGSNVF